MTNAHTRQMVRWAAAALFGCAVASGCTAGVGSDPTPTSFDSFLTDTEHALESAATHMPMAGADAARVQAALATYDELGLTELGAVAKALQGEFTGVAAPPLGEVHAMAIQRVRQLDGDARANLAHELDTFAHATWSSYQRAPGAGSDDPAAAPPSVRVTDERFLGAFVAAFAPGCMSNGLCK